MTDEDFGAAVRAMIAEEDAGQLPCVKCGCVARLACSKRACAFLESDSDWNARQIVARIRKMIDNERNER